jgi:hypothetical protein
LFSASDTQSASITLNSISNFSIGGSISGLTATGLVLQNNGGDNLTVASGASTFQFSTPVAYNGNYNVTVLQQPTGLICTISSGSGTNVSADVNTVSVSCSSLVLTNLNNSTVSKCTVSGSILSACADSGATGLSDPIAITFLH